ncbi:SurA N-terminal domain-containing protein [Aquamicrobium terrae]|uniref:Parvulin-like PPIase n=1 Tax=Aquamicrobium terrae TaxID=1324945 RepID=A0ABV2MTZ5_9HYPH
MLDSLRKAAGTWVAKTLLLILVLSFAVWGISGQVTGVGGHESVVKVGGTSVSVNEYRLAYDRQINALSQQFGQRLTQEQVNALGLDQQVLAQLVSGALLDEQARKMGLGISQDRLASLTHEDPAFRGPGGQFDRQMFDYVLRQVGMRPEDYLHNRSQVAKRQQIIEAATDGLKVPDTFLKAFALYQGEDRTVDYLVLPKSLVEPIAAPSDADLSAYFEENKQSYAAPEFRKFSYVRLEPEDIMDVSSISDQQVAEDYEKNKALFTTPETRKIEQIVFASEQDAQTARDSINSGATFDKVYAAQGKTEADIQLGTLSKDKIADQAVAEEAFALGLNEVSNVVKGTFGPVLLRVTEINPEVVKPLAEVTDQIRKDLALSEANRVLLDVHDAYEDARAGGDSMEEAASKQRLKVVSIEAIDRSGRGPDGNVLRDLPESANLIRAVFEAETGMENDSLTTANGGYLFYEVNSVTPARDRTLDEVRDRVVADWTAQETEKKLQARAEELKKRVEDGAELEAIASELSLEKQTKRGLKRSADDADFGREGAAEMFDVGEGGSGIVAAPTGDAQILFKVAQVVEPAGADASTVPDDVRNSFASGLSGDLLDQLVAQLQTQYQVEIDQVAISQALTR